jgi:hypothetical protein
LITLSSTTKTLSARPPALAGGVEIDEFMV